MNTYIRRHWLKAMMSVLLVTNFVGTIEAKAAKEEQSKVEGPLKIVSNISQEIMQEYLDAFSTKYPDVDIEYEYLVDYENEVKSAIEAGDYGDVLFVPGYLDGSEYTKYFSPIGTYQQLEEKYNYLESSKFIDKTVYGIPSSAYISGILYNKDVFYQAGISDTPKSIDEFIQALRDIEERTDAIPFYTNCAASWPLQVWESFPYIEMTGNADYRENIFVNESNPYLEGTTHYQVYELLYNIVAEGLCEDNPLATDWEKSKVMLNEGKIGCVAIGSWAVSQFKEAGPNADSIAFMPFPNMINGKQYMTVSTDYCYAISNKSENTKAAKAYIEFMLDESGYAVDHETLSIVKTDPYPESYGNMESVILLSHKPASGVTYQKKLILTQNLNLETSTNEIRRVIEAANGLSDENFDEIASDWNTRWESSRTPDMIVSDNEVKATKTSSVIVTNYEVDFSQTEKEYLQEKKTLKVGYVKNMAPLQYENEQGPTGVALKICESIKEYTGLEMMYYAYENTEQMIAALKNGEIEVIAGLDRETGYENGISYSKEYLSYMNVVVRNNTADTTQLDYKKVAQVVGETEEYAEGTTKTEYATYADAVKAVNSYAQDYTIMNYYVADYYIKDQECNKVSILPLSDMGGMSLAFLKGVDTRLVSVCNKCIYGIPDGSVQIMLRECMEVPAKAITFRRFVETNPYTVLLIVCAVFALIVAAIILVMLEKSKSAKKHALDVKRYEILASITNEYIYEYDFKTNVFHFDEKLQDKFALEKDLSLNTFQGDQTNIRLAVKYYEEANKAGEDISQAFQMTDKYGETQWYKVLAHTVCDSDGKPQHIIGKLMNVQKEIEEMQQMEEKAQRDPLTGIYNREGFQNSMESVYEEISENLPMTIAVMDFDDFKSVNDELGHAGGDAALQMFAETLNEIFAGNAVVARYGGDEFMVCIYATQEKEVEELLKKLVTEMDKKFVYQALAKQVSISVGAVYTEEKVLFEVLYKEADKMLYQTKHEGKNSYNLIHHLDEI